MNFEQIIEILLHHEGGRVMHEKDPGGLTNWGVAKKFHPEIDVENLTKEGAKDFYFKNYWVPSRAESLPPLLRLMHFDCAVNQGIPTAITTLQKAVEVEADGHLGPITLAAVNHADAALVLHQYAYLRWRAYARKPHWPTFGAGWMKRLVDVSLRSALGISVLK